MKRDLETVRPAFWPEDVRVVWDGTRLAGVIRRVAVDYGRGEEWFVRWRRGKDGWARGDGTPFPDLARCAESLAARKTGAR